MNKIHVFCSEDNLKNYKKEYNTEVFNIIQFTEIGINYGKCLEHNNYIYISFLKEGIRKLSINGIISYLDENIYSITDGELVIYDD